MYIEHETLCSSLNSFSFHLLFDFCSKGQTKFTIAHLMAQFENSICSESLVIFQKNTLSTRRRDSTFTSVTPGQPCKRHRRGHAVTSSWYTVNDKRHEHDALCSCVDLGGLLSFILTLSRIQSASAIALRMIICILSGSSSSEWLL